MNRLYLTLLVLSFALTMSAEPVGKQAALYTAQSYMLAKGKSIDSHQTFSHGRRLSKASSQSSSEDTSEGQPYYYVFNAGNDGGYVIVSADDRVEPILGYVEQGTFDPDNIPENMRAWLQGYADEIKYVIDNDIQPGSPILKKRNKIRGTKHSVPELLKSRWNQGLPYNLTIAKYYKEDGSQARPATGCIATAWAQVINFHKFPDRIKNQIPSYSKTFTLSDGTQKTVTFPAIPRGAVIDWENMRDTYSCSESHAHNAADTAVANLMRYCGQAVRMNYGSSSSAHWEVKDVINYFGFDDSGYRAGRDQYGIDEWFDLLYNEIAAGYPIPFSGTKISGGHAFVLDGFDGENLFHVNWGWGGGSNGWFLVGVLNSGDNSGMGAASGSDGYARGQAAVIGLRRPDKVKADAYLTVDNVSVKGTSVITAFSNKTGSKGSFHVGIVKLEDDGNISLVGSSQNIPNLENDASQSKTFELLQQLPEGTYRLSPASKLTTSSIWKANYNMRDQYIEAVVNASGVPTLRVVNPVYSLSIDTIIFPGLRIVKQEQEIKVTFRNNGDEFYKDVYLFASKTNSKVYTENLARVAVRKGETAEFSFYYTPEETGTYNLWFCTNKSGSGEIGRGTMEVITESQAVSANLAVTYTIVNGSDGIAYGKRLFGKANIKNNGSQAYHGGIKLQLWKQKVGAGTATSGSTSMFNIDVLPGKTVSVDFEFDNLSAGYYYHFKTMYANQSGNLSGGGIWDYKCEMQEGILNWRNNGVVSGTGYSSSLSTNAAFCGVYADCGKITRMKPNNNPNTIYAFATGMEIPSSLDSCNAVGGNHARHIRLVNDKPFYIPVSFEADTASFTYTFPETEEGMCWHTFTMPFRADSIFIDDTYVALDDNYKPFLIYEFAAQGNNGEVIFAPATELRGNTAYIIAADPSMAGRSIVFRSLGVPIFKTGSDKMVVTSPDYQFHGTTLSPAIKDCYVLNSTGTAFEYVKTNKTLTALTTYFTTSLSEEQRLPSIVLPDISDFPNGIAEVQRSAFSVRGESSAIYDLSGRKVSAESLKNGIYIIGGKKVLMK